MRRLALLPIATIILAACGAASPASPGGSVEGVTSEPSATAVTVPSIDVSPSAASPSESMASLTPSVAASGDASASTAIEVSPACRSAFDTAAAAIGGNSSALDNPSAFTDAIQTCTMDDWRNELNRLGGPDLASQADTILQAVCAQPEVANTGLCTQVQ